MPGDRDDAALIGPGKEARVALGILRRGNPVAGAVQDDRRHRDLKEGDLAALCEPSSQGRDVDGLGRVECGSAVRNTQESRSSAPAVRWGCSALSTLTTISG